MNDQPDNQISKYNKLYIPKNVEVNYFVRSISINAYIFVEE